MLYIGCIDIIVDDVSTFLYAFLMVLFSMWLDDGIITVWSTYAIVRLACSMYFVLMMFQLLLYKNLIRQL